VSEHQTPKSIDRQLRNVALPPGLLPRLREIASMGDAELDFLIGAVPLPEGTLDRLRTIGSLTDADLDGELRDVELPRGMHRRVERAMHWQSQRARLIGWAVAASLLAIISGVAYWSGIGGQLAQQAADPAHAKRPINPEHPGMIGPAQIAKDHNKPANHDPALADVKPLPEEPLPETPAPAVAPKSPSADEFVHDPAPRASNADRKLVPAVSSPALQPNAFGALTQETPNLKLVSAPLPRGVSGPRVVEYDLPSEIRTGRHPFVVPGLHVALRDSHVPIWINTSSYELSCRLVDAGQLPPPSLVHTEDFLAAMDYGFPLPTGTAVGIRTAAGPAPWGPAGMSLMQVGVQAARLPRNSAEATHLTLVVDRSAAMRDLGRWDLVRRAVAQLTEQLGPRDRVSVVFFGERAEKFVEQADQVEMRRILSAWNNVRLGGLADIAAGVELAAGVVRKSSSTSNTSAANKSAVNRMVLIADGLDPVDDRSLPHLRELLHETIDAGVKWEMIGLGQDATFSPQWDELAEIGGHKVRHAGTPEELFQRLYEALAGRSQVVAASVDLKVTFVPEAVSRYRLIGHEANGAGGLSGASLQQDLRSGQSATALYEVELKPDGPAEVAFVEVSWRDPVGDVPRHIRQPIGRLQFLNSWRECALPLQTAALAAETAEVLRSSNVLQTTSRVLDQVADLADEMNPALAERPGIIRLKQLIEQARSAKPARPGSARAGL
jgi:hypothetical protein